MLKGHKYFHSTPFPDKSNEYIFLQSPKTHFGVIFDHYWSFLLERDFSKKLGQKNRAVMHISIWALTTYKVSEKTNEPIPRKLPERRTDRRMEGRTDEWKDRP